MRNDGCFTQHPDCELAEVGVEVGFRTRVSEGRGGRGGTLWVACVAKSLSAGEKPAHVIGIRV